MTGLPNGSDAFSSASRSSDVLLASEHSGRDTIVIDDSQPRHVQSTCRTARRPRSRALVWSTFLDFSGHLRRFSANGSHRLVALAIEPCPKAFPVLPAPSAAWRRDPGSRLLATALREKALGLAPAFFEPDAMTSQMQADHPPRFGVHFVFHIGRADRHTARDAVLTHAPASPHLSLVAR